MIKKITTFLFVLFTIISLAGCASNKANKQLLVNLIVRLLSIFLERITQKKLLIILLR